MVGKYLLLKKLQGFYEKIQETKLTNLIEIAVAQFSQEWIKQRSPEFVKKDEWPSNSPDLNPIDYHVLGATLEWYKVFTPKPTNNAELKTVLEAIWEDLPQEAIDLPVLAFRKRLQACIRADGGHFEHLLK